MVKYKKEKDVYTGTAYFPITHMYYIHSHQKNIGRAKGQNLTKGDILQKMKAQKESSAALSKAIYKKMFKENISNSSIDLLNIIFETDDFYTTVDKGLKDSLQTLIDKESKSKDLMQIYRSVTSAKNSFINAYDNANTRIESFNALLAGLAQAVKLVESPESNELALALMGATIKTPWGASVKTLGQKLEKAVQKFIHDNEGKTFELDWVQRAAKYINYLAQGLKTGEFVTSGKGLSEKGVSTSIGAIFNTALGEGIFSIAQDTGTLSANQMAIDFSKSITSFSGDAMTKALTYDARGSAITLNNGQERFGKVDKRDSNVQISMEYQIGEKKSNIQFAVDIGESIKFYRGRYFRNLDSADAKNKEFELGSMGVKLGDAIQLIYGDQYDRYLAYNVMAKSTNKEWTTQYQAIQDVILTRFLLNAMSSRGGSKDFAQYLIANGTVVSVWELILYAENHFLGASHSEYNKTNQPITFTIPNRKGINTASRKLNMENRVRETNLAINNAGMKSYIHLGKLANAYTNK